MIDLKTTDWKEKLPMWAQLIKTRVKPGKEERARHAFVALRAAEQPDWGESWSWMAAEVSRL